MKSNLVRYWFQVLFLAAAYFAGGRFGLILSDPVSNITLVWPATGIAVAGLMRWGLGCWPGVFMGALFVEKSVEHNWLVAASIAVTNTLGPMVAAWLLKRHGFDPAFERKKDMGILCLAAMLGMLLTAGGGALNLCVSGRIPASAFVSAFTRWWLGDSGGVLLIGPLLLGLRRRELTLVRARAVEFAALCGAMMVGGGLVFMQSNQTDSPWHAMAFAILPLVVWGALRFGALGAAFAACGLSLIAAWATAMGRGEFYVPDMRQGTFLLWGFIITSGFLGLMVTVLQAERSRADLALRESEERMGLLVSSVKDYAIVMLEPDGRVASWNAGAERIEGYQASEIIGETFARFYAPEEIARGKPQQDLEEARKLGRFEDEGWRTRRDGSRFWVRTSLTAICGPDGNLRGFARITRDLTERKKAETEMEQQRLRLAGIVNSAMDGIITVDADGKIVVFNPAAESMFRCPAGQALGGNIERFVPECKLQLLREFAQANFNARSLGPSGTLNGRRTDGGEFPIEASVSRTELDGQKLFTVTCRDVTEQKKAEMDRVRLEAQLRQAQKMEAIGQLSGGIAHDFNNLLTIIQGNLALLKQEARLSAELSTSVDDMTQSCERAARLTGQLLAFGRRQTLQARDFNLNDAIANMSRILQRILGEGIALRIQPASQALFVHADPGMFDQVMLNLVINARDAMPKSGVLTIETSLEKLNEADIARREQGRVGAFACLTVNDTGSGIPPHILPRIFEPFFTTKEFGKGSGLGLATVYGIVDQHQGWVEVVSEVGRGSTFRVFLPWLDRPQKIEIPKPLPVSPLDGNETILLAEDEPTLRLLAKKILSRHGYTIFDAPDGFEATALWKKHRDQIQLLVTDIVMPGGMTGIELAKHLREERPELKVIYMSGYSVEFAGKDVSLQDGVNFLPKPFPPASLVQIIRRSLDE